MLLTLLAIGYGVAAVSFWRQTIRHHFQADLAAYWAAGRLHLQGLDPYLDPVSVGGIPFGRSQFLSGPLVAFFFRPLGALGYEEAQRMWFACQCAALAGLLSLGSPSLEGGLAAGIGLLLTCRSLFFPLFTHFERGQVDLIVALGVFASLRLWEGGHAQSAGAALFLMGILKLPAFLLFLTPIAAGDWDFMMGAAVCGAMAAGLALVVDGPTSILRYVARFLPEIERAGRLEAEGAPTRDALGTPLHPWNGRNFKIASFGAGCASLTAVVRRRRGWWTGTLIALLGLSLTLFAMWSALANPTSFASNRTLAWMTGIVAMLLFHPMTWVMGCVHLVIVGLRFEAIFGRVGWLGVVITLAACALIGAGDPITRGWHPLIASNRLVAGLLAIWLEFIFLLLA